MKYHSILLKRTIDSNALFHLTQQFAHEKGTCLLYSGSSYESAKHSFLFLFPYDVITILPNKKQRQSWNGEIIQSNEENPWKALKELGPEIGKGVASFPEWVGFFGYEMGAYSNDAITIPLLSASTPEAYWQRCALTLKVDHQTGAAIVRLADVDMSCLNEYNRNWLSRLSIQEGWDELLEEKLSLKKSNSKIALKSISDTKASYLNKIEKAKEFIRNGDVYQINLSQQWEFLGSKDPFDFFKQLAILNPAPFSAYFYLEDFSIISSSPERFLQKQGKILETRPIKGTAPRGKTPSEDANNREALLSSVKEKAELMMITDLMRNDLGKISEIGSVETPLLCACEAYQNVFHLYSIVRSHALPSLSPIDLVRACFPGGSITGCPKLRSMEVIAELESRPRGIYTGSIGYFTEDGDFDFNIAIRTIVLEPVFTTRLDDLCVKIRYICAKNFPNIHQYSENFLRKCSELIAAKHSDHDCEDRFLENHWFSNVSIEEKQKINVQLGGAIVIDSDPVKEYEETYHKGDSIFKILNC